MTSPNTPCPEAVPSIRGSKKIPALVPVCIYFGRSLQPNAIVCLKRPRVYLRVYLCAFLLLASILLQRCANLRVHVSVCILPVCIIFLPCVLCRVYPCVFSKIPWVFLVSSRVHFLWICWRATPCSRATLREDPGGTEPKTLHFVLTRLHAILCCNQAWTTIDYGWSLDIPCLINRLSTIHGLSKHGVSMDVHWIIIPWVIGYADDPWIMQGMSKNVHGSCIDNCR